MLICKELLFCLGQGEFPLLDNCTTTSFLSTVVYLDSADNNLLNYISLHENEIKSCRFVRYVDDLYILFDSDLDEQEIKIAANRIIDRYTSELKTINLSLNRAKYGLKPTSEINAELKKSLYDEYVSGQKFSISDFVDSETLVKFLTNIVSAQSTANLDVYTYNQLIESHFCLPQIESSPQENFNALVYGKNELFLQENVVNTLGQALKLGYSFMKVDVRRFVVMLTKTKNES